MESKLIKTIFFASLVLIAGVILTQDALGADTVVYAIIGGTDSLGMLDLNTGVFTQISTYAVNVSELGVYGGALYGAGIQCGCLFQLNPSTGVPTFAPTYFGQNASGFGAQNGFGSTTDGLFVMGAAFGGMNYLYSVNPETGVPTLIGSTGVLAGGGSGFLSASNDSSKLYWEVQNGCTDTLYNLNTSTGAATLIGSAGACYPSTTGNPFSMVFVGGTLWANFYSSGFGTINTSNGAQTLVSTGKVTAFFGLAPYPLAASAPPPAAQGFVPVPPCRVVDTRNANSALGGPAITGGTSRDFVIPNSPCGIPSTANAYSLNVAVVPEKTLGYLTLWPSGESQPTVATLNSLDGRIKSNAAIVQAGIDGAISAFATDTTDVILDINGYFVPPNTTPTVEGLLRRSTRTHVSVQDPVALPTTLAFYPLTPCRIVDTRNPADPLGGPSLEAQGSRTFPILDSPCGLPANAQAYSLNFAAVPQGPLGYLTAWPTGQPQPVVASLNALTGTVTANAVIVPAGTNGGVDVYATNNTDLVIDINGYFASPAAGGLSFYAMTPCRVLDTRLPAGAAPFSGVLNVNVTASPCGVLATAQAYVFNATVVPPGPLGYITLWPDGELQPLAATLNAVDGAITNNMAIVPTTNGSIFVFASNPTQLILDISAYFAP